MSYTFSIESECLRLRLRAGAQLACRSGSLWLTFESRGRRSPDVVLAPGERYRLDADTDVYVAALYGAGPAVCRIDGPRRGLGGATLQRWPLWPLWPVWRLWRGWLRRFRWPRGARAS